MFKSLNSYPGKNIYVIVSGLTGNMLESFDVMLCAFMSQIIADTFMPSTSNQSNLIYTFYIFFIGYLSRPVGSLIISLYADQIGRKRMLILSIFTVGIGTAILGCIPSYNTIGIMSFILFLIFRIIQNISVGGEYISSIAYLIEHGNENKRGFFGCWVALGLNTGTLLASILSFTIIYLIEEKAIPSWSWRFVFLFSLPGVLAGAWMRLSIPESIGFVLENSSTKMIRKIDIFKNSIRFICDYSGQSLAIFFISWLGVSATFAIFIYTPIHLTSIHHFSQYQALEINTISLVLLIIFIPIFGVLSDFYNRINMLILASILYFLLALPYFWFLSYGSYMQILLIKFVFSIISACFFSIAPVVITETFPLKIRCTTLSLICQTAASLAGGLTPIIMIYLANYTDIPHSPAFLLIIFSFTGLFSLVYLKRNPIKEKDTGFLTEKIIAFENKA